MKKFIAITVLFAAIAFSGCTDEDRSYVALDNMGFTNITFHGYDFFSCSESDTFQTSFKAVSPNGKRVEGAVCCGLLKNCTVRF